MIEIEQINEEVFYCREAIVRVGPDELAFLKDRATANRRQRARLCAHGGVADRLHEMIIVHAKSAYVRPHRHRDKSESFHMIAGVMQVVLMEDDGRVSEAIAMGRPGEGGTFYYRLNESIYHTVLPRTDWVVFHEVTNGPFRPSDTQAAPWAPEIEDEQAASKYLAQLEERIRGSSQAKGIMESTTRWNL